MTAHPSTVRALSFAVGVAGVLFALPAAAAPADTMRAAQLGYIDVFVDYCRAAAPTTRASVAAARMQYLPVLEEGVGARRAAVARSLAELERTLLPR